MAPPCHANGLFLASRSLASTAGERSNNFSLVTAAPLTIFMLSVQNLPWAMQESMFGMPSSVNQVQRGAAASISGVGTLVASDTILMMSASLPAAALLK